MSRSPSRGGRLAGTRRRTEPVSGFLVRCGPGAEYRKLILETLKLAPYTRTGSRTQDLSRFRLWKSPNRSRAHLLPALELPREPPRRRGRARATWRRTPRSGRAERHAGRADRRDVLAVDAAAPLQAARCCMRTIEHQPRAIASMVRAGAVRPRSGASIPDVAASARRPAVESVGGSSALQPAQRRRQAATTRRIELQPQTSSITQDWGDACMQYTITCNHRPQPVGGHPQQARVKP